MWLNEISIWSLLLISNRWRELFFFSCIILSVPYIQGEALQCSLHLYFQMLPLTSQPNSFSSPPLCLSLLCWHRVPIRSYPSHIWSFVFPIKGGIYGVHSYFLYFKPASGGLQMNEGVALVSARLSWDHLAHLIKHRGFNLVFWCTQKTTFTSAYTAGAPTCAGKHVFWPEIFITGRHVLFIFKLCFFNFLIFCCCCSQAQVFFPLFLKSWSRRRRSPPRPLGSARGSGVCRGINSGLSAFVAPALCSAQTRRSAGLRAAFCRWGDSFKWRWTVQRR